MFDSRYASIAFAENGTTLRVNHILCNGVDDGFAFQIDTLNLVACILRGRVECHRQVQSRMQSFSEKGETAFKCLLLHISFFLILSFYFFLQLINLPLQSSQLLIHVR